MAKAELKTESAFVVLSGTEIVSRAELNTDRAFKDVDEGPGVGAGIGATTAVVDS